MSGHLGDDVRFAHAGWSDDEDAALGAAFEVVDDRLRFMAGNRLAEYRFVGDGAQVLLHALAEGAQVVGRLAAGTVEVDDAVIPTLPP